MKYALTGEQAKACDLYTINFKKIPSFELMSRAGNALFQVLKKYINKDSKILIVCGSGNNGGDGYVLGKLLNENNFDVTIYQYKDPKSNECIEAFSQYKGKICSSIEDDFDVVVDAIFGIGLCRDLENDALDLIQKLNSLSGYKVAIDVPSGLDSTNGNILGDVFRSDLLITVQSYKSGFFLSQGVETYKQIEVIDIEIDTSCIDNKIAIYEDKDFKSILKPRDKISNKGTYGRVALIGGSKNLCGAPVMSASALASLRCGVGYSRICIPEKLYNLYALKHPENIYLPMKSSDDGDIIFDEKDLLEIINYDVIGIGMGIGVSENIYLIIKYLLANFTGTLVLDADALNSVSKYGNEILESHKCNLIITPHIKEFSRLTGIDVNEILKKELSFAGFYSKKRDLTLVLKSNTTIICNKENTTLNITGNPSLAKGGSGDILTGIISGLVSKTGNPYLSVCFGPYLLGKCAESLREKMDERSIIGTDLANEIGCVIKQIKE